MKKQRRTQRYIGIGLLLVLTISCAGTAEVVAETEIAGWRSSEYGYQFEAEPAYWIYAAKEMADKFPGSQPGGIWIVGIDWSHGTCGLSFPRPVAGGSYPNIEFNDVDKNERYLKAFDDAGLKLWLQLEPANANVDQLIDLVLDQYGHHPSVKGVGIDVEWLESEVYPEGRPVTNAEAERWINRVKSHSSSYKLFLKHWDIEWMPTEHYKDIVFISDSLDFVDLDSLIDNFSDYWAGNFPSSQVGFQIGYNIDCNGDRRTDRDWWRSMDDPAKDIGTAITNRVQNVEGIYWVDFTIKEVFPPDLAEQDNNDSCVGDFDGDGDIDGNDLLVFSRGDTGVELEELCSNFGTLNCLD
jgi:hypothetical protein